MRAARTHVLGALYWAASHLELPTLADGGYDGAGIGVFTPVKQPADGRELDVDTRTYNALLRGLHCLGERGFALHILPAVGAHFATSPPAHARSATLSKAALVLTHFEDGRLT